MERQEFAAAIMLVENQQDLLLTMGTDRAAKLNAHVDVHVSAFP
jgi:hypothetical protein